MTKRFSAKFKKSRATGVSIHGRENDAIKYKSYRPGQHGNTAGFISQKSNYGKQLVEKQKIKYFHNMTESAFRRAFDKASVLKGNVAENFATILASRLDCVVYLSGFVASYYQAQQLVSHKHVLVNGKKVNINSYLVKANDLISLTEKANNFAFVNAALQENKEKTIPDYLSLEKSSIRIIRHPLSSDGIYPFDANFRSVVEFYSK